MTEPRTEKRGVLFWVSAAIGWGLIAWGIRGALHHHVDTRPRDLATFFVGGALAHDLILAPIVLTVGVVLARRVRGRWLAPVQTILIIAGCTALFAWPEVRDYARVNHNPSSLPHNYTANLVVVLAAVVLVVVTVTVATRAVRRRAQAS